MSSTSRRKKSQGLPDLELYLPCLQFFRIPTSRTMSTTSSKYDLVVIGGGPAGYAAAIRALGKGSLR